MTGRKTGRAQYDNLYRKCRCSMTHSEIIKTLWNILDDIEGIDTLFALGLDAEFRREVLEKIKKRHGTGVVVNGGIVTIPGLCSVGQIEQHTTFRDDLTAPLNKHSMENASSTPDFVLCQFLEQSLVAFDNAVRRRNDWQSDDRVRTS